LPSNLVIRLHQAAEQVFSQRLAPDGSLPTAEYRAEARKLSFVAVSDLIGAPPNLSLVNRRILALARAYLGHEPTFEPNSFVRCMAPGPNVQALPFHQYQAVLRRPLLNIWAPLDPCGVTAPGLEVVPIYCPDLLDSGGDAAALIPVERVRLDESRTQTIRARSLMASFPPTGRCSHLPGHNHSSQLCDCGNDRAALER
jgi:hypothetical protein